ncbi:hypothetical protein AB4144_10450 [Rhizobiaceae sp. 2RAB30]
MYLKALLPAAAMALLLSSPSFADKPPMPPGQAKKLSHSAPGPIAALGLPAGVVIGGYVWLRRRAQKGPK